MRIGVLTSAGPGALERVERLGFRSCEWVAFEDSPAGPDHPDGLGFARELAAEAADRDLRISAIGAYYKNPLDPRQTERARAVLRRAIEVAGALSIPTVAGFAGAVVEGVATHPRGGQPVMRPPEDTLPELLGFWEPLARYAQDHGVRIAFEHCPQGPYHLPIAGYNALAQPAMWERFFDAAPCDNLGIEWDPAHLVCQLIDPVQNVRRFGSRIFHVHAKDAWIDRDLLATYGICHPGVAEHRFPGLGQSDWGQIVHALVREGYDSDLNVEGRHDPVYRDHAPDAPGPLAGRRLEDEGLAIARRVLERFVPSPE